MAASGLTRRGSFHLLRSVNINRRNSCPELKMPRIQTTPHISSRNLNLMVMNPKAPKIRHLNASHPLLIELEENVQKVQVSQTIPSHSFDCITLHISRNLSTKSWSLRDNSSSGS